MLFTAPSSSTISSLLWLLRFDILDDLSPNIRFISECWPAAVLHHLDQIFPYLGTITA